MVIGPRERKVFWTFPRNVIIVQTHKSFHEYVETIISTKVSVVAFSIENSKCLFNDAYTYLSEELGPTNQYKTFTCLTLDLDLILQKPSGNFLAPVRAVHSKNVDILVLLEKA